MPRGELVGQAWIAVHADTSGIDNDIRRGFRSADFEQHGEDAGDEWSKGFADKLDARLKSRLRSTFEQGFVTGDFGGFAKQFNTTSDAIDVASKKLLTMRGEGHLTQDQFINLGKAVVAWSEDVEKAARPLNEVEQATKRFAQTLEQDLIAGFRKGDFSQFAKNFDDITDAAKHGQRILTEMGQAGRLTADEFRGLSRGFSEFTDKAEHLRDTARVTEQVGHNVEQMTAKFGLLFRGGNSVRSIAAAMRNFGDETDSAGARLARLDIGKFFGRGARNNFLNLVGVVIGGAAEMGFAITRLAGKGIGLLIDGIANVVDSARNMGRAFSDALSSGQTLFQALGEGAKAGIKDVGAAIASILEGGVTLVPVIAGLGIGFAATLAIVGPLVSALSLLAGAITAVASAVAFGLAGAALAAAPALLALGAAAGVTAVAFMNMSKNTQKAFEPLKKTWSELASHVSNVFFDQVGTWVSQSTSLLKTFVGPTMTGIAEALRNSVSGFLNVLSEPSFAPFLKVFSDSLPKVVGSLSSALGKAAAGMIAFFAPIMPFAERLAAKIDDLATSFLSFATSAAGQAGITDFMTKAWQSASALWGILTSLGSAIGTIFSSGQQSGQSFLDWVNTSLSGWADSLKTPEGKANLQQWFQDAKTFGTQLIDTIKGIGTFLAKLDTPENRAFATNIAAGIGQITALFQAFSPLLTVVGAGFTLMAFAAAAAFGLVAKGVAVVANAIGAMLIALGSIPGFGWAKEAGQKLQGMASDADRAGQELLDLPKNVMIAINGDTKDLNRAKAETTAILAGMPKEQQVQIGADITGAQTDILEAKRSMDTNLGPRTVMIDADPTGAQQGSAEATAAVGVVPPFKTTDFQGNPAGVKGAAGAAQMAITAVDPTKLSSFLGDPRNTVGAAATATGAIVNVPASKLSEMLGNNTSAVRAADGTIVKLGEIPGSKSTTIFAIDQATGTIQGVITDLSRITNKTIEIRARYITENKPILQDSFPGVGASGLIAGMAPGGVLTGPRLILAGEAGPEAVVPLNRSLAMVDPSVRALSAYAQGKAEPGKSVLVQPGAIVVTTPSTDPVRVAEAVLDRMVLSAI